jgi:hypothetical protein
MLTRWNLAVGAQQALICTVLLSSAALADPPQSASTHDPGSWQKHQYSFAFMGFTTTYSCDGLADKLKLVLLAAGARADAKSQPGVCAAPYGRPDKFARADLTFYTLAPDGHDTADSKPADGVWRRVRLSDRSPRELRIGDCELVDQFREQVLPMFTTRNVENRTTCIPHQESGSVIDLKFESFAAPAVPPRHVRPSADTDGAAAAVPVTQP